MKPTIFIVLLTQVNSPAASLSDLSYVLTNNNASVRIVGCNKAASGDLDIPSSINGLPVTEVEDSAFSNCDSLVNVTVPGSISVITGGQFRGCDLLETVTFAEGVSELQKNVFLLCSSLHSVQLPSSLELVDDTSFSGANALTSLSVSPSGSHFSSSNGVLYNAGQTQLECVPNGMVSYNMPSSVLTYRASAFGANTNLTTVSFGSGLTQIRAEDFSDCTAVNSYQVAAGSSNYSSASGVIYDVSGVTLVLYPGAFSGEFYVPSSVEYIGEQAFFTLSSQLTKVHFSEGLIGIGGQAFKNCGLLNEVTFPSSLTSIGDEGFWGCASLGVVDLSGSSSQLGEQAFRFCSSLSSLSLPSNLIEIPYGCFANCESLTSVVLPAGLLEIGEAAFSESANLAEVQFNSGLLEIGLEAFFGCEALTEVKLPEGLISIGEYTFAESYSLEFVSLPLSLTSLGDYVFEGSSQLATLVLHGDAPISDLDLLGFSNTTTVYHPSDKLGYTGSYSSLNTQSVEASSYPSASWLLENKLTYNRNMEHDINGDGVTLLEAFALGLNPHTNLTGSVPMLSEANGGIMDFEFKADVETVSYLVQTSSGLGLWNDVPNSEIVDAAAGRKLYKLDTSTGDKRFVRLKLELQPAP